MTDESKKNKNWSNKRMFIVAIAVSFMIGIGIANIRNPPSDTNIQEYTQPEPPEPMIIELSESDFNVSIEKPSFSLSYELTITYSENSYRANKEINDVNLTVSLVNKKTVNVQQKNTSVQRWMKGQALKIEDYDTGIDGFDLKDFKNGDIGFEITGSAKSGDDVVEIKGSGYFN